MKEIDIFIKRLAKIGINVTLIANYPWIYLDTINKKRVTEKCYSSYGFTIAFLNQELKWHDLNITFRLIRQYL